MIKGQNNVTPNILLFLSPKGSEGCVGVHWSRVINLALYFWPGPEEEGYKIRIYANSGGMASTDDSRHQHAIIEPSAIHAPPHHSSISVRHIMCRLHIPECRSVGQRISVGTYARDEQIHQKHNIPIHPHTHTVTVGGEFDTEAYRTGRGEQRRDRHQH